MSFILLLALLSAFSFEAKGQDTEQIIQIPLPQWLEIKGSTLSKDSILVGEQVVEYPYGIAAAAGTGFCAVCRNC